MPEDLQALEVKVRQIANQPGMQRIQTCFVTDPDMDRQRRVWKSVSMLYFGREGAEPTHRELHVQKWTLQGGGFHRTEHWYCRDDEVANFHTFLDNELEKEGNYAVIERAQSVDALLTHLERGEISSALMSQIASRLAAQVEFVSDLDDLEGAELLATAVDLRRRKTVLDRLEDIVLDPESTESDFQRVLDQNWWLLGGDYVGKVPRRQLTVLDQFDLPLVRADNVLHIVELKKANVANLVVPYRNHFAVGKEVNEAVNQAANYLRAVDEKRAEILADFSLECRRAQATVIVGHPAHINRLDVSDVELREAIRTYNSHLARIEVLTYEDVIATARNSVLARQRAVEGDAVQGDLDNDHLAVDGRRQGPLEVHGTWEEMYGDEEPF